jgi:hypothetical protein
MNQNSRNTEKDNKNTRRDFGKGALWAAPTLTVLLAASSQRAAAAAATSGDGYTPNDPS